MEIKDWHAGLPGGNPGYNGAPGDATGTPSLSVILPCFNEEKNIEPVYQALIHACEGVYLEILFIDDGSSDRTCEAVKLLSERDPDVRLIRFVRNAGHQNALRAGYRAARGRWVLTMDADLQHPPEAIPAMLLQAKAGFEVVQMVRTGSQAGFLKERLSRTFYKVFNMLSDLPITGQASDFRLISRSVCDVLNALPERKLMVRAILPYLGFRTASLTYQPGARLHGNPGYGFFKSMRMGSQAIFDFSSFPLKLAMRLGGCISALAFLYGAYNVAAKFLTDRNVPGYTDIVASILFLGGLMLLYMGVLGRYLLVILDHLKSRPEYLIEGEPAPKASGMMNQAGPRQRPPGRRAEKPDAA